ncbi:MAG TPA: FHA domain-containing protein, partial [Terriglobia bacterium]|nr:FHA domain-containing protein [Terriglobia bacterium]
MFSSLPRLIVHDIQGNTREIEIAKTPFTIGRQVDSGLVLLDNRVSRRHAQILRDTGSYILEDVNSRHGTYVNSQRVERWRLKSGDRISLGASDSYRLTFVSDEIELNQLLEKIEKP